MATKARLSEPEFALGLPLIEKSAKALLDERSDRGPFARSHLASLRQKGVRDMYGCFHTSNHISLSDMYSNRTASVCRPAAELAL
jgi:hypothetical protein